MGKTTSKNSENTFEITNKRRIYGYLLFILLLIFSILKIATQNKLTPSFSKDGNPIDTLALHTDAWQLDSFDYIDAYWADGKGNYTHQRTGDKVSLKNRSGYNEPPYLFVLLLVLISLVTSLVMAFRAPQQNVSKKIFLLAFLPLILSSLFMVNQNSLMTFLGFKSVFNAAIFDIYKVGIITTLALLAVSIGYRTNQLKQEKKEAQKNKELKEAKTQLYTNITHELIMPLTVILGMTNKMNGYFKDRNSFQHQEAVDIANRNGEQLLRLVSQMLDLSKLESKSMPLEMEQGNIILFIKYIFESFQPYAESKNIRLQFFREMESVQMDFDQAKIQQIISNLLSNAIKFTPVNGLITLHLGLINKNNFLIKVQDVGKYFALINSVNFRKWIFSIDFL